jgi:hypothetical protein
MDENQDTKPPQTNLNRSISSEIFVSNNEITKAIHATNREIANISLQKGLMIDSRMGFAGVAIGLSQVADRNLSEITNTHNHLPVIVVAAYPNIHKDVVILKESGKLPKEFAEETLFAKGEISQVNTSGTQKTDTYFDNHLIEGYYDKDRNEWVCNPNYWERQVEEEAGQQGWNKQELTKRKTERLNLIRQTALERLLAKSQEYQKAQEAEIDEWWTRLPPIDETRIP